MVKSVAQLDGGKGVESEVFEGCVCVDDVGCEMAEDGRYVGLDDAKDDRFTLGLGGRL